MISSDWFLYRKKYIFKEKNNIIKKTESIISCGLEIMLNALIAKLKKTQIKTSSKVYHSTKFYFLSKEILKYHLQKKLFAYKSGIYYILFAKVA